MHCLCHVQGLGITVQAVSAAVSVLLMALMLVVINTTLKPPR